MKLTKEIVLNGKDFVTTVTIKSELYGDVEVDIHPIPSKKFYAILGKYKNVENSMDDSYALMKEICSEGMVDKDIVDMLDDTIGLVEAIGQEILNLSKPSVNDVKDF